MPVARRNARVRLDRGKLAMKSNLAERRAPRRDHCLGAFQPPLADVAMRRRAHGGGKRASKMKDAETRDIGEVGDRDVVSEMLFDIYARTRLNLPSSRRCPDWIGGR